MGRLPPFEINSTYRMALARSPISFWTLGLTGGIAEALGVGVEIERGVVLPVDVEVEVKHS